MTIKKNPKIALVGSVNSSLRTLKKLHEHNCSISAILGLSPDVSNNVSGYVDLKLEGERLGYPSAYFTKINDLSVFEFLRKKEIDLLFVVGLSQMVREPLLSLASIGNVGFHPTKLPQGRGRGAVAWILLGKTPAAATFFLMDEGMDSGPILGQKSFEALDTDYAEDIIHKIKCAIDEVLDELLPQLNNGALIALPQDHEKATFLGVRKPKDGMIDWSKTDREVYDLIRATSTPLPGAFSEFDGSTIRIWRSQIKPQYTGVPGRIVAVIDGSPVVCCGRGSVLIEKYTSEKEMNFRIGKEFA
ncbi:methionyl-tRNA formyltransferase [Flagellimonas marinaquae]